MFNKIAGAILGTLLVLVALRIVAEGIFGPEEPEHVVADTHDPVVVDVPPFNLVTAQLLTSIAAANPATGQTQAAPCMGCHTVNEGGATRVGPNLYDVVGRPIGSVAGFTYSEPLAAAHTAGKTWTYEELNAFLKAPGEHFPGTRMASFRGVPDDTNRAALIAYLRTLSHDPEPLPAVAPPATPATPPAQEPAANAAAAVEARIAAGNPTAGQTVAARCAGCHTVNEGGATRIGPNLYDVVGRPIGSMAGFTYSPALQAMNAAGDTWTYAHLDTFLTNTQLFAPGSRMTLSLPNETDRANLIAYLRTLSGDPEPLAGAAPPAQPEPAAQPQPTPPAPPPSAPVQPIVTEPAAQAPAAQPETPAPAQPEAASPAVPVTLAPVTFTAEQAAAGQTAYGESCINCHGASLADGFAPPLNPLGARFLSGSVGALFDFIHTNMPMGAEGTLSTETYVNIIAYILSANGFTPGATALPVDPAALSGLGFERAAAPAQPASPPVAPEVAAPAAQPEPTAPAQPPATPPTVPEAAPAQPEPTAPAQPPATPPIVPEAVPAQPELTAPAQPPATPPAVPEAAATPAQTAPQTAVSAPPAAPVDAAAIEARIAAANPTAGQAVAARCAGCHTVNEGGATRVGPNLYDVVGRPIGSVSGFTYSPALQAMNAAGDTWTYAHLDTFLTNTQLFAPGSRMTLSLPNETDRANLIAYLRTLSGDPEPLAGAAPPAQPEPVAPTQPAPTAAEPGSPAQIPAPTPPEVAPPAATPAAQVEAPAQPAQPEPAPVSPPTTPAAQAAPALTPITFTAQQAAQGASVYSDNCAGCHGANGAGADGPALQGNLFAHWFTDPVSTLHAYISVAMPASDPGSLSATAYIQLVAYLAQLNGFAAGPTPLPSDPAALATLGFIR